MVPAYAYILVILCEHLAYIKYENQNDTLKSAVLTCESRAYTGKKMLPEGSYSTFCRFAEAKPFKPYFASKLTLSDPLLPSDNGSTRILGKFYNTAVSKTIYVHTHSWMSVNTKSAH